jgi:hypothetical protein
MIKLAAHLCSAEQSIYILGLLPEAIFSPLDRRDMPSGTILLIYVHPMSVKSERGSNSSIPGRRTESSWSGRNSR